MSELFASPFFSISLCVFAYAIGIWVNKKIRIDIVNPLLVSIIIIIAVLKIFNIPLSSFNKGGDIISLFLAPATASLALSIYNKVDVLKRNLVPVIVGASVGPLASMSSVFLMCKLFGLSEKLTNSILPKSVTTTIAIEVSKQIGGTVPITVAAVIVTGISGAIISPYLIKLFKLDDSISIGVAMGTSCHALGTAKSLEMGEIEGAMSGIAVGVVGVATVIYALFI